MPPTETILNALALTGYAVLLSSFFLALTLLRGRQTCANVIIGMLLAWPLWLTILTHVTALTERNPWLDLAIYVSLAGFTTWLTYRIMPDEFQEKTFESTGKKILIAVGATGTVLLITFGVLGLSEVIPGGRGVAPFFAAEEYSVWWLLAIYLILFFGL